MADLEKLITPRTKAFILNTPSNPNGCMWSREQLQQLADLAVKRDFYIVADEIYEKLVYSGEKHYSIATFGPEIKARTILINGVSKSYAMTGFRIGYACGPRDVIKGIDVYKRQLIPAATAPDRYGRPCPWPGGRDGRPAAAFRSGARTPRAARCLLYTSCR